MQRKAPGDEPLPECQGQAQQGEEAKNQVQDHCSLLMVVVRAMVIECATQRPCKSEIRTPTPEGRNPNAASVNELRSHPGNWCVGGMRIAWQAAGVICAVKAP